MDFTGPERGSTRLGEERPVGHAGGYGYDVLVIGGGIVGLSTTYALTRAAPDISVAVLEKEPVLASHQTGRNSGVIHSGVYYRPGSLKAHFAVRGAAEMVDFCSKHGIPHQVTGKLIVATERAELPQLHTLAQRGRENDIPVRELGPAQIAEAEPGVRGLAALHVSTTGVCDFGAVARALAELAGADIRTGTEVLQLAQRRQGVAVRTTAGELTAKVLVNCAGLHCDRIARMARGTRGGTWLTAGAGARIIPFRGEYYALAPARRELVRGLVYPVPDQAFPFLGVHLTRDVHGGVHIGPNAVPALSREGYTWRKARLFDIAEMMTFPGSWRLARRHWRQEAGELHRSLSKRAFTAAVRRLLPEVTADDLVPAPAGVRAQAVLRDGSLVDDFLFAQEGPFVHVLNAPSPAATASLPIGREIAKRTLAALKAL